MRLDTEFCKLPFRFDHKILQGEVSQFAESDWRKHPQGYPGNTALSLISVNGDPNNDSPRGSMFATPHLKKCPYLRQVLGSFQSIMGRTRLMRIAGDGEATAHVDTNYYWLRRTRIHVPIVTVPDVRYVCNDKQVYMAPGETWIFNTWQMHNSINPSAGARIHLVADTVGSPFFWDIVSKSERPFADKPNAASPAQFFGYDAGRNVEVTTELLNFPVVMSPAEQDDLLNDLLQDLRSSKVAAPDAVARLEALVAPFRKKWKELWDKHGTRPDGFPHFRTELDKLHAGFEPLIGKMQMSNGMEAIEIFLQAIIRPALNPDLAEQVAALQNKPSSNVIQMPLPATASSPLPVRPQPKPGTPRVCRPVIIVSAPRSGSSLLFETLARSPGLWTVGGESHLIFEQIPQLSLQQQKFHSNRLTREAATPEIIEVLESRFLHLARDRNNKPLPFDVTQVRLLEKTPKNSLRIPFLNAVFPDALFIYLYREPNENISSIMDAWRSNRFVTYPQLPEWQGPWSLLLIPGWQQLKGKTFAEVAAAQWAAANSAIMEDLSQLPQERWTAVRYSDFIANPQAEVKRLCEFAGVAWDQELQGGLPLSKHTLTPPDPNKWKKNEAAMQPVLPSVQSIAEKARELMMRVTGKAPVPTPAVVPAALPSQLVQAGNVQPNQEPQQRNPNAMSEQQNQSAHNQPSAPGVVGVANQAPAPSPLRSVHTGNLPQLFEQLGVSMLVSTYQAGKLIAVRVQDGKLNTHFRNFPSPMGMACDGQRLAIGTSMHVWQFRNQADVGRKLEPLGKHDACFMPRSVHFTGDIRIHEISWSGPDLWIVNTRFSCLCKIDHDHSFVPLWRPRFITALSPDDRCHLNGMCLENGFPKYVTALGQTDKPAGWRENKASGGILIDVPSGETVITGLSMPHSPRLYAGKLWVLESGKGTLSVVDPKAGKVQTVAELPGFTRGLSFSGPFAFIGLSQIRESNIFGGLPLTERIKERICGVWVVDIRTGQIAGFMRFEEAVQEIFAVNVLPGIRFPDVINDNDKVIGNSFVLPDEALKLVPKA